MTCKDCIHRELCNVHGYIDADECGVFKNKADVVEVKHGEWKKRSFIVFDDVIKEGYCCSECQTTWDTNTNYCPYCGADMRGDAK